MEPPCIVEIEYAALCNGSDLDEQMRLAFGPHSLGVVLVTNVPHLAAVRVPLLQTMAAFAALPASEKTACEDRDSGFLRGWSHGRESMAGKPDVSKGSYYSLLQTEDGFWPQSLPLFRPQLEALGGCVVGVGLQVAAHIDAYLQRALAPLPATFVHSAIVAATTRARVLHYFPAPQHSTWCGLHVDHSILTGLTAALYTDHNTLEFSPATSLETTSIQQAGLYIKNTHSNNLVHVAIPPTALAFQIGEAAQIASGGLLVATLHLVKSAHLSNVARNTFATFMQVLLNSFSHTMTTC